MQYSSNFISLYFPIASTFSSSSFNSSTIEAIQSLLKMPNALERIAKLCAIISIKKLIPPALDYEFPLRAYLYQLEQFFIIFIIQPLNTPLLQC